MTFTMTIDLTENEFRTIRTIASQTGQEQSELIKQAITQWIANHKPNDRLSRLRGARGLWKNRTDLPDAQTLRKDWDREIIHE